MLKEILLEVTPPEKEEELPTPQQPEPNIQQSKIEDPYTDHQLDPKLQQQSRQQGDLYRLTTLLDRISPNFVKELIAIARKKTEKEQFDKDYDGDEQDREQSYIQYYSEDIDDLYEVGYNDSRIELARVLLRKLKIPIPSPGLKGSQ